MTFRPGCRPSGFSLIELLVVIGIIILLLGVVLAVITRVRGSAGSVNCVSNLRQIGLAFSLYAEDNRDRLPDPFITSTSWERLLLEHVENAQVFRCPADEEVYPMVGSSYDWRDTGDPKTTLAGRTILEVTRPEVVLVFEALPGWHAPRKINAVLLDGSARSMDQEECFTDLAKPIRGQ